MRQTCYEDMRDNDTTKLVITNRSASQTRVTELRSDEWCAPYQMENGTLDALIHAEQLSELGTLSDEQFDRVMAHAKPGLRPDA